VDVRTAYSECRFVSGGGIAWARVNCAAPATCNTSNPSCTSTCVPGEKRCAGEAGTQTCGAGGTWLPAQPCNTGASTGLACRVKTTGATRDGSLLPDVECVDEICALLGSAINQDGGVNIPAGASVCDGSKVRVCGADGKLGAALACTEGACRAASSTLVAGYLVGSCSASCKAGEQRCVSDGLPLYLSCGADSTWSTAYQSCGTSCSTVTLSTGLRTILCGDECLPGSLRCDGANLQKCGSTKKWLPSAACSVGRCAEVAGGAVCRAECLPGSTLCVGATKDASDGISSGTAESVTCSAQGLRPAAGTPCSGTGTCRTSQTGVATGCVECLGPSVPGGNEAGLVDSRCATSGTGVQICGTGNDWSAGASCGTGAACFVGRAKTCGACPPATVFIDGKCTVSNLSRVFFRPSCESFFGLGRTVACGDTPDCCSAACQSGGAFAFCAPEGFSPCLGTSTVTPLAGAVPQRTLGSTAFGTDLTSPSCSFGPAAPDAVFSFKAPRAGIFAFDTFGSTIDTVLVAIDPLACGELACGDSSRGVGAGRIFVQLAAGQAVLVVVQGLGDFALNVVDTAQSVCGNGFVNPGEACDRGDFAGQTCQSATFGARPGGALGCNGACQIDTGGCTTFTGGGGAGGARGSGGFGASTGGATGAGGAQGGGGKLIFDASLG
jgi:hypothetical protein